MLGAPLCGKGTQSARLSALFGIPTVSSGDLFRAEVAKGTEIGLKMKIYMDAGQLVPNELTTPFLTKTLSEPRFENGLILDGTPSCFSFLMILLFINISF